MSQRAEKHSEGPSSRAQRLGYVAHGTFKLKIAYSQDVILDDVLHGIARGSYERTEGFQARNLVVEGDRVIELGAGLGFLSALIMSTTSVADYLAVEADPRLTELIWRTHELNMVHGPLTIKPCVATCSTQMIADGSVKFFVSKKFCASSLLEVGRLKHSVQVPVVPLTDLIRERTSNVLICDIEGAEIDVFNGTDLGTIERIMMEIHPDLLGQIGVQSVLRNIDKLGFVNDTQVSAGNVLGFRKLPG